MERTYYETNEEAQKERQKGDRIFFDPYVEQYYIVSPRPHNIVNWR